MGRGGIEKRGGWEGRDWLFKARQLTKVSKQPQETLERHEDAAQRFPGTSEEEDLVKD